MDSDVEIKQQPMSRIPRQEWEWSVGHTVRIHTHDVRALAIHEPSIERRSSDGVGRKGRKGQVLVSGGLDTSLSLYSVPGFKTLVSDELGRDASQQNFHVAADILTFT